MEANIQNWDFDYINDDENTKYKLLLNYCNSNKIKCLLDKTKNEYSFVEKTVYDISKFHLDRLNIDINREDIYISFWFKTRYQSCNHCTDLHFDSFAYGDDSGFKTSKNPAFLSIITYLTDNEDPTIITNVSEEVIENKKYMDNPSLCFSFPKKYKQISFNGGKYIHGEASLFEQTSNELREMLIITFTNNSRPMYVPYYNEPIFFYQNYEINRVKFSEDTYHKNYSIISVNKSAKKTQYVLVEDSIINDGLFENIIENKKFHQMNVFSKIFKSISIKKSNEINKLFDCSGCTLYRNADTCNVGSVLKMTHTHFNYIGIKPDLFYFDLYSNSSKYDPNYTTFFKDYKTYSLTEKTKILMKIDEEAIIPLSNLHTWNIHTNDNSNDKLIEYLSNDFIGKPFILNHSKPVFDIIEKYVYDIAQFHLNRMNIDFNNNVSVEFSFSSTTGTIHTKHDKKSLKIPLLTTVTYLNGSGGPLFITNIHENAYKFKKIDDKTMCICFPKNMKHIAFNGGQYYHHTNICNNIMSNEYVLYVNLWLDYCPNNTILYSNTSSNYNNDTELLTFTNHNGNVKKLSIDTNIICNNFFEKIFYKKNNDIFYNLSNILYKEDIDNYDTFVLQNDTSGLDNNNTQSIHINEKWYRYFPKNNFVKTNEYFTDTEIINNNICDWIMNEVNKYISSQLSKLNVIDVDNIPKILKYLIKNVFDKLSENLQDKFELTNQSKFDFNNIFITQSNILHNYINTSNIVCVYLFLEPAQFFISKNNHMNHEMDDDFIVMEKGDILIITQKTEKKYIKTMNNCYMIFFTIHINDVL